MLPLQSAHAHPIVLLEFIWAQEEAQNMGAWSFVEPHFRRKLGIEVPQIMHIIADIGICTRGCRTHNYAL